MVVISKSKNQNKSPKPNTLNRKYQCQYNVSTNDNAYMNVKRKTLV